MHRGRYLSLFASLLAIMLVGNTVVNAQESAGLNVGEKAPSFKLKNQTGEEKELSEIWKQGTTALVFHRSASW